MQVFLETERLVLRRFSMADADNLVELDGDPEVMHFITGGRPTLARRSLMTSFLRSSAITSVTRGSASGQPPGNPPDSSWAGSTSGPRRAALPARPSSGTGCASLRGARATRPKGRVR